MSNALGRAAQPLVADLEKHGISVYMTDWRIEWRGFVIQLQPHTPRVVCRAKLNKLIKAARKTEAREHEERTQSNLFGGSNGAI